MNGRGMKLRLTSGKPAINKIPHTNMDRSCMVYHNFDVQVLYGTRKARCSISFQYDNYVHLQRYQQITPYLPIPKSYELMAETLTFLGYAL